MSKKRQLPSDQPSLAKTAKTNTSSLKPVERRAAVTVERTVIAKRRDSWQLSDNDANAAMALMQADGLTEKEMNDDLRVFLYAKGIMGKKKPMVRKSKFHYLLNPNGTVEEVRTLKSARERLRRIVVKGEEGQDISSGSSLFDKFVAKHSEWGPKSSFVVFRDHMLLKDKPHAYVERIQLSGLCYMHAPVILQHYLVAMFSSETVPMLDMAIYLKKHISAEGLERRIWRNEGGSSLAFLEQILIQDPASNFLPCPWDDEAKIESCLKKYGPALISCFKVEDAFDSDKPTHIGPRAGKPTGIHAMVLVGIRKQGKTIRYLVQNWWKKKAFVEMDREYLRSCGGILNFVMTKQTAMGTYPTNSFDHVECEMLDATETFILERAI